MSGTAHCSVDVHASPLFPCGAHVSPRHCSPFTQLMSLEQLPPGTLSTQLPLAVSHAAPAPQSALVVQPTALHVCVSGAQTRSPAQSAAFVHSAPFGFP